MTKEEHDEVVKMFILKMRILSQHTNPRRDIFFTPQGEKLDVDWRGWDKYSRDYGIYPVYAVDMNFGDYAYVPDKYVGNIVYGSVKV